MTDPAAGRRLRVRNGLKVYGRGVADDGAMGSVTATRRPARAVVGGALGVAVSAAAVAFAAQHWIDVIVLYGFLIGMSGGLMAWMVLDELDPDLQGSRVMAAAGVATATVTYGLYEYLRYRFAVAGLNPLPGWGEHLLRTADQGAEFGRLGRTWTAHLGPQVVWGARALELAIAMCCGGCIARAIRFRR